MSRGSSLRLVGRRGLASLREELTERDMAIVSGIAELRLLATPHIRALHFPIGEHKSELAATRACQRALNRLVRDRLLIRLERRRGGIRAGSDGFTYALGPVGQRILSIDGTRRRFSEPTLRFLEHTLAIAQIVVDVTAAETDGSLEVLACQAEPKCHRQFSISSGWVVLRPDLFLALGVGDLELRWFVEIDMATESVPTVLRKCRQYQSYYQAGKEQERHGVFPQVCWVVPNDRRAGQIRRGIAQDRKLTDRLFCVTTTNEALHVLKGGEL